MSRRLRKFLGFAALGALAIVTSVVTHSWMNRAEARRGRPLQMLTDPRGEEDPAARLSQMQPNQSWRNINRILDGGGCGGIDMLVDVECWHGEIELPKISPAERFTQILVCVYGPDDPRRQKGPLRIWRSDAVEVQLGLYQERVPVQIPMPPAPKPYHLTVELVSPTVQLSQGPLANPPDHTPRGYCGSSVRYQVY